MSSGQTAQEIYFMKDDSGKIAHERCLRINRSGQIAQERQLRLGGSGKMAQDRWVRMRCMARMCSSFPNWFKTSPWAASGELATHLAVPHLPKLATRICSKLLSIKSSGQNCILLFFCIDNFKWFFCIDNFKWVSFSELQSCQQTLSWFTIIAMPCSGQVRVEHNATAITLH